MVYLGKYKLACCITHAMYTKVHVQWYQIRSRVFISTVSNGTKSVFLYRFPWQLLRVNFPFIVTQTLVFKSIHDEESCSATNSSSLCKCLTSFWECLSWDATIKLSRQLKPFSSSVNKQARERPDAERDY